jgi:hypothetical protein
VTYVAAAALDQVVSERKEADYRFELERIQSILGLRPSEMARLLNVSHEGLRKWSRGAPIADERLPRIDELYDFSTWISSRIKPESIAAFMHRRTPALGSQTPIDWLVSGRLHELRSIYERAFSYEQLT